MLTLRFAVGIEEVNLYKDDGTVIHFNNPKFHVGSGATMYVVSGRAENKTIQDIIPSLLQNSALGQAAAAAAAAKKVLLHLWPHFRCDLPPSRFLSIFFFTLIRFFLPSQGGDDDVPELVESFESS
jgi:nascent polypeptide-associated complex subunit beta